MKYAVGFIGLSVENIYEYHYGLIDEVSNSIDRFRDQIENPWIDVVVLRKYEDELHMYNYITYKKEKFADDENVKFISV